MWGRYIETFVDYMVHNSTIDYYSKHNEPRKHSVEKTKTNPDLIKMKAAKKSVCRMNNRQILCLWLCFSIYTNAKYALCHILFQSIDCTIK